MRNLNFLKYRQGDLSPDQYSAVSMNMLTTSPSGQSAARYIEPGECATPGSSFENDTSFSRQINQLVNDPCSVHPQLKSRPDAYVFTANSAIPVADAIREYYKQSQFGQPIMTHIEANRISSTLNLLTKVYPEDELSRLEKLLVDTDHVCVVEQFVDTGRTLSYAAELLFQAGVEQVSAIRGGWYANARLLDIYEDKSKVSSKHAAFMREIGKKAFQQYS